MPAGTPRGGKSLPDSPQRDLSGRRCGGCAPPAARLHLDLEPRSKARAGLAGFASRAMSVAEGMSSRNNSNCFGPTSTPKEATPVILPPGRFRLATSSTATGSAAVTKTIGIVAVAAFAASAGGVPATTITPTCRRTRSVANTGSRSFWPSAQRYSIFTLPPSTGPVSLRPWWNARRRLAERSGASLLKKPITGIADCCARAITGHVTAAPAKSRDELPPPHIRP